MECINIDASLNNHENDKRTNFQKVVDWNKTFGIATYDTPKLDVFKDKQFVEYRMNLIREEIKELEDAIKNNDMIETYDALCDILVVVYGAGASFGLDLDKGMHLVNDSNMSKSCVSEEEAIKTVKWYKENEKRYDSPIYRKSDSGNYWIVYNESSGKILKSINWKIVDFKKLLDKLKK